MSGEADPRVVSRGAAYDEIYRKWHAKQVTTESFERWARYFANAPTHEQGHLNGNEIDWALKAIDVDHLGGKRILDLCCGTGRSSIYFALKGAFVDGVDASSEAIEIARESARLSGVGDRTRFAVMDAQRLEFDSRRFDAVYCQSALHILIDYPACAVELARVLKPGGKAVFCEEALGHNPLFAPFRWIRRRRYAECGGRPLRFCDLQQFGAPFRAVGIHPFNLLSQVKMLVPGWVARPAFRCVIRGLDRVDRWLLHAFPSLGKFCGKVVVEYHAQVTAAGEAAVPSQTRELCEVPA